jgi:hypothetical protein
MKYVAAWFSCVMVVIYSVGLSIVNQDYAALIVGLVIWLIVAFINIIIWLHEVLKELVLVAEHQELPVHQEQAVVKKK